MKFSRRSLGEANHGDCYSALHFFFVKTTFCENLQNYAVKV